MCLLSPFAGLILQIPDNLGPTFCYEEGVLPNPMNLTHAKLGHRLVLGVGTAFLLAALGCRESRGPAPAASVPNPAAPEPSEFADTSKVGGMGKADPDGVGTEVRTTNANLVSATNAGGQSHYIMDPVLAARYGLLPRDPNLYAREGAQMDPALAKRYGLGPRSTPTPEINTTEPAELLKLGLFEEEGNRAPSNAIRYYEKLVRIYDGQRTIAATTIFRLAECSRKLGLTNEALQNYQRLVAEFAEMKDLVTLAKQNIAGLSGNAAPTGEGATGSRLGDSGSNVPAPTQPNLLRPAPPTEGFVTNLELSPVELAELERNITFLEAKLNEGNEEVIASAIRIVFPRDRVLAEMEDRSANIARAVVEWQVRAKDAEGQLDRLEKQRPQLEKKVNAAEAASKAASGASIQTAQADLNELVRMLSGMLSTIEQHKRAIQEPAKHERLLAKAQAHVVARRRELVSLARLQAELARAVSGQTAPEAQTRATLAFLEKAASPGARSALIQIAFRDPKLEALVGSLRSAVIQVDELQASGDGDLAAAQGSAEHAQKLLQQREEELVRISRLRLELSQNTKVGPKF